MPPPKAKVRFVLKTVYLLSLFTMFCSGAVLLFSTDPSFRRIAFLCLIGSLVSVFGFVVVSLMIVSNEAIDGEWNSKIRKGGHYAHRR